MSEENKDIKTTADVASEPVTAYAPTVFDAVISYLHSTHLPMETKRAVYLQLQAEVADENFNQVGTAKTHNQYYQKWHLS